MPVPVGAALVIVGGWVMVIENPWVALGRVLLAAVMVPLKLPVAVGVPEMVPPVLRVRPVGRLPDVTVNVMGAEPEAVQMWL